MIIEKWANGYLKMLFLDEREEWNRVVKLFGNWDVYYLSEYAYSFMIHGDGIPCLIEYKDEETHFCYVVMKRDISDCEGFWGKLEKNKWFDFETPYGYGGPLSDREIPEDSQKRFLNIFSEYCSSENIVSQFIRFHPLLGNHMSMASVIETRYMHDTIYMDTSIPKAIMVNMDSACRNKIRKAVKQNITVECKPITEYEEFSSIYTSTMCKNNANDYYYFKEDYFKSLVHLKDNACIFYAMYDGKPIGGSIMYYNKQFMHYHLSGSYSEYTGYPSINLILSESAFWAANRGIIKFHLGGGMNQNDSLFGFKKQFNKYGKLPFIIGRTIFDTDGYDKLLWLRKSVDSTFNMENDRMIQYRQ